MENSHSATSVSLLSRLRSGERDENAWRGFIERYGPRIHDWCLNRKLQASDADDVTQNVLVKLARNLQDFAYDPTLSFRGWLRRVTENAIKDYLRERHRQATAEDGTEILERLHEIQAPKDLIERLGDAFDLELMDEAMARVSARVTPNRWLAWYLTAKEGRAGTDVAGELDMKVASVYTAKNQVQKMIHDEIQMLEKPAVT